MIFDSMSDSNVCRLDNFGATQSVVLVQLNQVVYPSVCLSVTLRYRGRIGWNTSKVISCLISITNPEILAGIGVGV